MENIKQELIEHLGHLYDNQDWDFVVCGFVNHGDQWDDGDNIVRLVIDGDVNEFLNKLDIEISPLEYLEGTIWYADGTWSEFINDYHWGGGRWVRFVCPEIPETLHKKGE